MITKRLLSAGILCALIVPAIAASLATRSHRKRVAPPSGFATGTGLFTAANNVWNTPIPIGRAQIANSAAALSAYVTSNSFSANPSKDWMPTYEVAPIGTTIYTLPMSSDPTHWNVHNLPVPAAVESDATAYASWGDTDAKICLADHIHNLLWSLEYVRPTGGAGPSGFQVGAAIVQVPGGLGWWTGGPQMTASNTSLCGGIVLASEAQAAMTNTFYNPVLGRTVSGIIPHALVFTWPSSLNCNGATGGPKTIYPANSGDGTGTNLSTCIPEGARMQVDPALTDAQILAYGVNSADLPIVHALQAYGAYDIDSTGGGGGISFEAGVSNGVDQTATKYAGTGLDATLSFPGGFLTSGHVWFVTTDSTGMAPYDSVWTYKPTYITNP